MSVSLPGTKCIYLEFYKLKVLVFFLSCRVLLLLLLLHNISKGNFVLLISLHSIDRFTKFTIKIFAYKTSKELEFARC